LLTDQARFFENVGSCHWTINLTYNAAAILLLFIVTANFSRVVQSEKRRKGVNLGRGKGTVEMVEAGG